VRPRAGGGKRAATIYRWWPFGLECLGGECPADRQKDRI